MEYNNSQIKIVVEKGHGGLPLDKFLKKRRLGIAFGLMQKLLRKKAIRVNGKRAKPDMVVNDLDEIIIPAESRGEFKKPQYIATKADAEKYLLKNILYEDANCIAINKPQGLATQGGSGINVSVDALLPFLAKDEQARYMLVHRLDKDTSGVLIIAKTRQAAQILGDSFKHRLIEKKYMALVAGKVEAYNGAIDEPLGKRGAAGGTNKIVVDELYGKSAYTEYKVVKTFGRIASLLEVTPHTGRKHQIRVHLAHIGHPIIGDGKYGGNKAFVDGLPKFIHLHAWKLRHTENYFKPIEAKIPKYFDIDM